MSASDENLVIPGHEEQWLLASKSTAHVAIKRGMPCITILVHGVNDVGEAFPNQEEGLCAGLNARLRRKDLTAGEWALPPEKGQGQYTEDDVHPDPDKVYFQRKPDQGTSPIIPFYWGFREQFTRANTTERHGQYLDRYGNRIDKRLGKNGGPFANATTNIPDMFGRGFVRNHIVKLADPKDGTHPLLDAPSREYMILAAQRLAALLRIIRKKSPNEPVNIVAHSQGCFVTLLAHAMLAKEGKGVKADTVVLNNPPYSLEEPFIEKFQTGSDQQTAHAREETLRRIIAEFMTVSPATVPSFSELKTVGDGVVGKEWSPTENMERDNRGKVFLYFSPDDATVGLPNIQGIGWWGVYEDMRKKLGDRFFQRLFTSPRGKNSEAPEVGSAPHEITLSFKFNVGHTFSRKRQVNAEALQVKFTPDLGPPRLMNGPIDAAIAITNRYTKKKEVGIRSDESPEQAAARWLNRDSKNSYHSGVVSNPTHSEKATAYDISIGISQISKDNNLSWMQFLRAAADWRTNWFGGSVELTGSGNDPSFPQPSEEMITMLRTDIADGDRAVIVGNFNYYGTGGDHPGILPQFTIDLKVEALAPFIVSESVKGTHRYP